VACEGDAWSPVALHFAPEPEIFIYWPIPDRIQGGNSSPALEKEWTRFYSEEKLPPRFKSFFSVQIILENSPG